jgi:aspartate/methionine/tyrosine aminotransferase
VSFAPGSIYGQDGSGYIRFSLGTPTSEIEEAMDRLRALWS